MRLFVLGGRHKHFLCYGKQLRELGQERLIGKIEAQRRDGDAVVGQRGEIGAVLAGRPRAARVGDPEIRIAAAVVARVDVQQLLIALAWFDTEMPLTAPDGQSGKLTLTSTSRGMPCLSTRRMMSGGAWSIADCQYGCCLLDEV